MNTQRPESACACPTCKKMCQTSPCFPTPAEARTLIERGYAERLALSVYIDQLSGDLHPAITARFDEKTGCTFQDEQTGLCELHEHGLKPTEGRLAHHSLADAGLRLSICESWHNEEGGRTLDSFPDEDVIFKRYLKLHLQRHIAAKRSAPQPEQVDQ